MCHSELIFLSILVLSLGYLWLTLLFVNHLYSSAELQKNQWRPLQRAQNTTMYLTNLQKILRKKILETPQADTTKCHNLKHVNLTSDGVTCIQILRLKEHVMVKQKSNIKLLNYQWCTHHFSQTANYHLNYFRSLEDEDSKYVHIDKMPLKIMKTLAKSEKIIVVVFNHSANLVCIQIKLKYIIQTYLTVLKVTFHYVYILYTIKDMSVSHGVSYAAENKEACAVNAYFL